MVRKIGIFFVIVLLIGAGAYFYYHGPTRPQPDRFGEGFGEGFKKGMEEGEKKGYEKGFQEGEAQAKSQIPPVETLPKFLTSKVVEDAKIAVVLKGKITEISNRTVVLAADGESLQVTISEYAVMYTETSPEKPPKETEVKMEELKVGEEITIFAAYSPETELLEAEAIFEGYIDIEL